MTKPAPSGYTPSVVNDTTPETTLLTWRLHRLKEEPQRIALVALGYGIAIAMWRLAFPQLLGLFLPLIALTGAMAEYLFPIEYKLTDRGAHMTCGPAIRLFLAWDDVRRATKGTDGIYLSSLKLPSRLDAFRGIRLRFVGGNEAMVEALVREKLGKEAAVAA